MPSWIYKFDIHESLGCRFLSYSQAPYPFCICRLCLNAAISYQHRNLQYRNLPLQKNKLHTLIPKSTFTTPKRSFHQELQKSEIFFLAYCLSYGCKEASQLDYQIHTPLIWWSTNFEEDNQKPKPISTINTLKSLLKNCF